MAVHLADVDVDLSHDTPHTAVIFADNGPEKNPSYMGPNDLHGTGSAISTPTETPATRSESVVLHAPSPFYPESYHTPAASSTPLAVEPSRPESRLDLLHILSSSPYGTPSNTDDWACDLELMHHYCTVTCNSLTIREDARHVWRIVLPMEGYSNSYLMHGILALAALHRACLYPAQKEKYIKASSYHQAAGLKKFRELIASPIDPSNWQPVFCFASMIMVYVCASPIRLGADRWPTPILNIVELFAVVNGLQTIMEPWLHSLRKTQLAPLVNCVWLDNDMLISSPSVMQQSLLPPDIRDRISQLHQFIDNYPFPQPQTHQDQNTSAGSPSTVDHREAYKNAMKFFEHSTRQLELAGPHIETGMIIMWAYSLSKRFQEDLEAYKPAALILLAHWCVLLHLIDHCWFINGASRQLLEDIESKIHPGFQEWLVWPKRWVYGNRTSA
ncbi:hypothetical protein PENARI_c005G08522 [Penicillium arizonense]|uniref:Uncharacterized protein n=1 Tax=Penicillium arizonense TaxID=1835702 RepID=A0A1F5LQ38_PENAI|nr:hypothetical protein PENARI_c005G08522 [Penicillium arizonense]OGE55049.1 hypothetical protein PENARI_c005G08522 [Penicillium arizonense]